MQAWCLFDALGEQVTCCSACDARKLLTEMKSEGKQQCVVCHAVGSKKPTEASLEALQAILRPPAKVCRGLQERKLKQRPRKV